MEEVSSLQNHEDEPFKVLEFYSGIGGMRYSLMKAGIKAQIVQAFEINDVANDVYHHNFGHRPYQEFLTKKAIGVKRKSTSQENDEDHIRHFNERNYDFRKSKYSVFKKDEGNYFYCYGWKTFSKGNIQSLTASDLDKYQAHAWLLSPPCQPYTRQGLQKDSSDARAFSFLNILDLIPQLSNAPLLLLIENVVGFETSKTHNKMTEVLAKTGYLTQEFILSPLQFGVPYSRPRYFCLAKMKSLNFQYSRFNNQLLYTPSSLLGTDDDLKSSTLEQLPKSCKCVPMACKPVQMFLEFDYCSNQDVTESRSSNDVNCSSSLSESAVRWDKNVGSDGNSLGQYFVPLNLIERWGSVMDIVYPDSKRCCCFTKSYYRYVKGTGSLLATIQPKLKGKESPLEKQGLRYFTPREVANLHSFPKEFCFPEHVSLRQRYALLGNSLSVAVVSPLLSYLFSEPDQSV